jgi:2'-5' RNA ligase
VNTNKKRRLFFALWPDPVTRKALAGVAHHWSRHPLADANLHMTLVFLGACDEPRQQCLREAAATVIGEPFELRLDYLGGWARSRTQWLGTSRMPAALGALVETLTAALAACGVAAETRKFVPHITLSRKVSKPRIQAGLEPLVWAVGEFVLAESLPVEGGVRYAVRERWALAGH